MYDREIALMFLVLGKLSFVSREENINYTVAPVLFDVFFNSFVLLS